MTICPCCRQELPAGQLVFNHSTGTITFRGEVLGLTKAESDVFYILHTAYPKNVALPTITHKLYGAHVKGPEDEYMSLRSIIYKLRGKIERLNLQILTKYGQGYRLVIPPTDSQPSNQENQQHGTETHGRRSLPRFEQSSFKRRTGNPPSYTYREDG